MPHPTLVHGVPCTIQPVNKAATDWDRDAREPVRGLKRSAAVEILGQDHMGASDKPEFSPLGSVEDVAGYVVLRVLDCDEKGYAPKRGDRFVRIGNQDVEYYTTQVDQFAYYPDVGGHTLLRLYLTDRRPAAANPRM